jgi:hypothetical protein
MSPIWYRFAVAAVTSWALATATVSPAVAGGFYTGGNFGNFGGYGGGGGCPDHPSILNINKNINININTNINKNININKNVIINKNVVIVKAEAEAFAFAQALAAANANAGAQVTVYNGGSYEFVNVRQAENLGAIRTGGHCEMQEASVVKSIHAVCVTAEGREFPASHMTGNTWIDAAYEGEIARCLPGSRLKVTIGDVVQSDQGMAGTYSSGVILQCAEHEAVRHFKDGMLKCAPAVEVPDCTERTNLRKYGTGDMFFTYRSTVCANSVRNTSHDAELDEMSLNGGVGDNGY